MRGLMAPAVLIAVVVATLAACDTVFPGNDGTVVVRNGSAQTYHLRLERGPDAVVIYRVGPGETGRAAGPPDQGRLTRLMVLTEACDELVSSSDPAPGLIVIDAAGNFTITAGTPADAAAIPPLTADATCL